MKTIEIAGETYNVMQCFFCSGTGVSFDSTNQDNATGSSTSVKCSHCSGKGECYRMVRLIQSSFVPNVSQEIGDIPDWMC